MTRDRESTRIKRWLAHERPQGAKGDDMAAKKIERLWDLKRTTPLDRDKARSDLNVVGYYRKD